MSIGCRIHAYISLLHVLPGCIGRGVIRGAYWPPTRATHQYSLADTILYYASVCSADSDAIVPLSWQLSRDASGAGFAANPLDKPAPRARKSPQFNPHGWSGNMRPASGAQWRRGARKTKGRGGCASSPSAWLLACAAAAMHFRAAAVAIRGTAAGR